MTQKGPFIVLRIIVLIVLKSGLAISNTNVTWEDAVKTCQENKSVIEDSIDRIMKVSFPAVTQFWLPKYSAITPWIDLIGCFSTEVLKSYREVNATSLGFCQNLCTEETYFGFNRKKCVCVSNVTMENQIENMNCKHPNSFKVYKDNIYDALDLGLCKIGRCKNQAPHFPKYIPLQSKTSKCVLNGYGIASFCRNGHRLADSKIQNEALKECESPKYNSSLPNMLNTFCQKHESSVLIDFWLSKFRVLYNGTQDEKDPKPVPASLIKCTYGYVIDGRYSEDVDSCLSMKSVLCRYNDKEVSSSTPSNKEKSSSTPSNKEKSSSTPSNKEKSSSTVFDNPLMTTQTRSYPESVKLTGAITGGVVGVIIIALAVITVIACRRSIGKKRKTKQNSSVQFSVETHDEDDNQNVKELPSHPTYGIDICTATNTYAKVNKNKDEPKETMHSNLYVEACNGEYDHLNKFRKREITHTENTYDSHAGMQSIDDFTYDSSDFGRRQFDDKNDVYDHSFPTTGKDEEYDCSTNVMTKPMNENRIYMDNYSSLSML